MKLGTGTVIVDPPWPYHQTSPTASALPKARRRSSYGQLSIAELMALPVGELADYLFLWTTVAFTEEAYQLVRAWGFVPVTKLYWIKTTAIDAGNNRFAPEYGVGFWFRGAVEEVIVGKKPEAASINTPWQGLLSPNYGHSRKPENIHEIIESDYPQPHLELFARQTRRGWTCLGNDIDGEDIGEAIRRYQRTGQAPVERIDRPGKRGFFR
jgi:N6-adenosine-specific RNA methylase IME4